MTLGTFSCTCWPFVCLLTNVYSGPLFSKTIYLAVLGLSCGPWDPVPCPGIKPGPPALGAQNLSHWTNREVPFCLFFFKSIFVLLFALLLSCRNSFRIQGISPLLRVWFANTFSRSVGCLSLGCWFPLLCGSSLVWCNPPPLVWLLLPLCVLFSYFSSLLAYIYHSRNISVAAVS